MRAGAAAATGHTLLFLHADTRLGEGALAAIAAALADPAVVGGNFRLLFDGGDGFSRWLEGFYAWLRRRGVYSGDSAILVRRAAHDAVGGVAPLPLMEDFDFVRRLQRAGRTVNIEAPPAITSSRRFASRAPWRIVLGWVLVHLRFALGVSTTRLAEGYGKGRGRPGGDAS